MNNTQYKYSLDRSSKKFLCSGCQKRTMVKYVDNDGKYLPEKYGRCDRQDNCQYHKNPYSDGYGKSDVSLYDSTFRPAPKQVPKRIIKVDPKDLSSGLNIKNCNLYKYMRHKLDKSKYSDSHIISVLELFGVKPSDYKFYFGPDYKCPEGATLLPLINQKGEINGGQVALFDMVTGSTIKKPKRHTRPLYQIFRKNDPNTPEWAKTFHNKDEIKEGVDQFPCLYGVHQLAKSKLTKPVAIVEAPKTAIINTILFPEFIWMASSSKDMLKEKKIEPLKDRRIILYPDQGPAYKDWLKKAKEFKKAGFCVLVSSVLEKVPQPLASGSDIIDYVL